MTMTARRKLIESNEFWFEWESSGDAANKAAMAAAQAKRLAPGGLTARKSTELDNSKVYDVSTGGDAAATRMHGVLREALKRRHEENEATLDDSSDDEADLTDAVPLVRHRESRPAPAQHLLGASFGAARGMDSSSSDSPRKSPAGGRVPLPRRASKKEDVDGEPREDSDSPVSPLGFAAFAPTRQMDSPPASARPAERPADPPADPPAVRTQAVARLPREEEALPESARSRQGGKSRAAELLADMRRDRPAPPTAPAAPAPQIREEAAPAAFRPAPAPRPQVPTAPTRPGIPAQPTAPTRPAPARPAPAPAISSAVSARRGPDTGPHAITDNPFEMDKEWDAAASPASTADASARYAVILEPGGRVRVDQLIETMAAFLGQDIRDARRAIRRGKGLLAMGLSRSDATVLESALVAEGQAARAVRLLPAVNCEPPRLLAGLEAGEDPARFEVIYADSGARGDFAFDEIRLLGAGLIAPPADRDADAPAGLALDLFGAHRSQRWRLWQPMNPEDAAAGRLDENAQGFLALLCELASRAPRAAKTPIFEKLVGGSIEPKLAFPDFADYENYQRWIVLARFAPNL
jgi:hypothetical protein